MADFLIGSGTRVELKVAAGVAGASPPTAGGTVAVLGGTQSGFSISSDVTDSTVFESVAGFVDGVITSQSWEVPWTGNVLDSDGGYDIVRTAALDGAIGGYVGLTLTVRGTDIAAAPIRTLEGSALVTNFSEDYPADGIITWSCTFTGKGAPTLT